MEKGKGRIEAPLIRRYVRELPWNHAGAPQFPSWLPWALGIGTLVLGGDLLRQFTLPVAILAGLAPIFIARVISRPTTPEQIEEQRFLDSLKWMRAHAEDGSFRKRFPPSVLQALERVATARTAELARLVGQPHELASIRRREIEERMRAALAATVPVFRNDHMSKREWTALAENYQLVRPILDALEMAELKISEPGDSLTERLQALRELDDVAFHELTNET